MAKRRLRITSRRTTRATEDSGVSANISTTAYSEADVTSLIIPAANGNPVLVTVLEKLVDQVGVLTTATFTPPILTVDLGSDAGTAVIPTSFTNRLTDQNVILEWTIATSEYQFYEIRKGTTWDQAEKILVTNNANAILDPLLVGTHTYLLKALDTNGKYSASTLATTINIPNISGVTITAAVVANAVTLAWTFPTSQWRIDYYRVRRDGKDVATTAGTFFAISEEAAGEHIFGIIPVDIAGNQGPESQITVVTTGVTDYQFFARLNSNLTGTIVNGKIDNSRLYVCVNTIETIQQHFDNHSWINPQAQVNAGYPAWLSPFLTSASYTEIFDFGQRITNVVVSVNWLYEQIYGSTNFGWEIQVSDDGVSWSSIKTVPSFYTTSVRYVKAKINFTSNDKSLLAFYGLSVSLNVKRENDGGFGWSYASDTPGTPVNFTKVFVDIDSITVTPVSTTSTFSVYEFNDIPFPTTFTVKIYDNSGVRKTCEFKWAARGVV